MPSGGARTRSGPAPDPNSIRGARENGEWTTLPAEGRRGNAPAWPLSKATKRETELWRREWKRPQALMWERNVQHLEVALYVRRLVEAECRDSAVNLGTLVRQMMDSLGLTAPGMKNLRWKILHDEVSMRRASRAAETAAPRPSSRSRLRVVAANADKL